MTASELIVCLQGLPLLADLKVRDTWQVRVPQLTAVTYEVLDRLTPGKSGDNLSLLKHITISTYFELDDQAVLHMVESRRGVTNLDANGSTDDNA
jgi:hypothetical protein